MSETLPGAGAPQAPQAPQAPESKEQVIGKAIEGSLEAPKPSEAKPKDEPLSSRFAALARKEKEARKRADEAKNRFSELEAREAKLKEMEEAYSIGKKNPIEALKKLGWSYEDITNHILNDQKPTPESEIKSVRDEMDAWKKQQEQEREQAKLQAEERKQQEYQKALEDFKVEMNDFIKSNEDTYELINLNEAQELVYATIEEHYQDTLKSGKPKVLSNKEACDLVEQYLESQVEKITQTKKFKSKYQIAQEKKEDKAQSVAQGSKTLSNNMASSAAPSSLPAKTENERLQRALAALNK